MVFFVVLAHLTSRAWLETNIFCLRAHVQNSLRICYNIIEGGDKPHLLQEGNPVYNAFDKFWISLSFASFTFLLAACVVDVVV